MSLGARSYGLWGLAFFLAACGGNRALGPDLTGPVDVADIPYIRDTAPGPDEGPKNHPPVLARIGDRVVAVGQTLRIELEATDPDGDPLTFSVFGDIPEGAKFDKVSHVFTWTPLQANKSVFLTFVVSDGKAMDRETIEIRTVAEGAGHPPVLERVSDQKIEPDVPFSLVLQATDPDGDSLEFGISPSPPEGATIDSKTGKFLWTAPKKLEGQVVTVAFFVTDGTFEDRMDVKFVVGESDLGSPPVFSPIPDQVAQVGQELSILVEAKDPDGQKVTIKPFGDLPKGASFDEGTYRFTWVPDAYYANKTISLKFRAFDGYFQAFLTVKVSIIAKGPSCSDDEFEPNNSPLQAKPLAPGVYNLSICDTPLSPVDSDWFLIALQAGDRLEVTLRFEHDFGDIDMDLSLDGSEETIVAYSAGTSDEEHISFVATSPWTYVLAVYGVADTAYSNPYTMEISISQGGTCKDDQMEENDYPGQASLLSWDYDVVTSLGGLVACPGDDDFFVLTLQKGLGLLGAVTPKGGEVLLSLLAPDGKTILAQDGPSSAQVLVALESAQEDGSYYLLVRSKEGAKYTLEALVEKPKTSCTQKSCDFFEVCNLEKGTCVPAECKEDKDCPKMPCIQGYCVEPCSAPSDCREGYWCKAFPVGSFCGIEGWKGSGEPCTDFTECEKERVCLFAEKGGYCAVWGCTSDWDCPLDSWCSEGGGATFCAAECKTDEDCNKKGGFYCIATFSVDNVPVSLCLPK